MVRVAGWTRNPKNRDPRTKSRAPQVNVTMVRVAGKIRNLGSQHPRTKGRAPQVNAMTEQVAGKIRTGVVRVKFLKRQGGNVQVVGVQVVGVNGGVGVRRLRVRRLGVRKSDPIALGVTLKKVQVYAINGVRVGTGVWVPCATPRVVPVLRLR